MCWHIARCGKQRSVYLTTWCHKAMTVSVRCGDQDICIWLCPYSHLRHVFQQVQICSVKAIILSSLTWLIWHVKKKNVVHSAFLDCVKAKAHPIFSWRWVHGRINPKAREKGIPTAPDKSLRADGCVICTFQCRVGEFPGLFRCNTGII